jgi:hypothetical protein
MNALKPHVLGPDGQPAHRPEPRHAAAGVPAPSLPSPSRRLVLKGLGGAALALPFLESWRPAGATPAVGPFYSVFLREGNGVAQADYNGEPEQFWPRNTGVVTQSSLSTTDADRAVSELAAYADRLLLVKGTRFSFYDNVTCGHSGGGNQVLTAARVSDYPSGALSLAMGESIDNYIARHHPNNGGEPLTLYTGPRDGYLEEVMSYRGPYDLRSAEDDPWTAYLRMVGGTQLDELLENRRKSINDLVRGQMQTLLGKPWLSTEDRRRLELHFDAIRDFEGLSCRLNEDEEQTMATMLGQGTLNANRVTVAQMHCDLIALAFSCDFARVATLQIGDGNDGTQYTINGETLPRFHQISHRIYSDGSEGDPIVGAIDMHHQIDRLFLQIFARLLDKLESYGLMDRTYAVNTNDLGAGVSHTYENPPWVIAGPGDGLLKQGEFVDLGGDVSHNKLLNTLISAAGIRDANGDPITNFGDPELEGGIISEIVN